MTTVSITEDQVFVALRAFLLSILPSGVEVVQGQVSRVPEPASADFAVMWPTTRRRIETNTDVFADVAFTGSILGATLTVTQVSIGTLSVGAVLLGSGLTPGTAISALAGGTGGVGDYTVNLPQTLSSRQLAAGTMSITQPIEMVIQVDVHGPSSADNAQIISTLMRDEFAVGEFEAQGLGVVPLYADDPVQLPFPNAEQQWENRWKVDVHLQVNPIVVVPQAAAQVLVATTYSVDAVYPPNPIL